MSAFPAAVRYSEAARLVLSFFPAFSDAVEFLKDECRRRPDVVVAMNSDHPHGITVLGLFCGKDGTFSIDTQSARSLTPCIFSEAGLSSMHQLGAWKASVPMSLDEIFAALYSNVRPKIDNEVDMSEIQDRLLKAPDGVPFRISTFGIERVFQKLVKAPGLACEGFGVMYQTHHPERARMLLFQPLVCKIYSKK